MSVAMRIAILTHYKMSVLTNVLAMEIAILDH